MVCVIPRALLINSHLPWPTSGLESMAIDLLFLLTRAHMRSRSRASSAGGGLDQDKWHPRVDIGHNCSVFLLMNFWVLPIWGPGWIKLLWVLSCNTFWEYMFSLLLGKIAELRGVGPQSSHVCNFTRNHQTLSQKGHALHVLINHAWERLIRTT